MPNPSVRTEYEKRIFLSGVQVIELKFSFLLTGRHTEIK